MMLDEVFMNTNWNKNKSNFTGRALSWDQKDDIQKLLTMLQNDAVDTLNSILEYSFIMDFISDQTSYINKAPCFWSEVIKSLRFTLIMKTARLFDESKDAIGLKKAFHILEQSHYGKDLTSELNKARSQYDTYHDYIIEIRTIRDTLYAHNDKKDYQFWKNPNEMNLEFEGEFWKKLEEIIIWARDTLLTFRTITGDSYPVNIEISNDICNLLAYNNN